MSDFVYGLLLGVVLVSLSGRLRRDIKRGRTDLVILDGASLAITVALAMVLGFRLGAA